ncbi:MAG: hypothetical protein HYY17_14950 [Planctomycetes bacterium]|nr:hypothetical protein [Planctomycetota bacterium]
MHALAFALALAAGGLTDAEIDAIAAAHSWPSTSDPDKMRGYMLHRGTVPREAAAALVAAFMEKHGLPASKEAGFDWYCDELAAGFVYDRGEEKVAAWRRAARSAAVHWRLSVEIGREPDFVETRRSALRQVEAAVERFYLDLAKQSAAEKVPLDDVAAGVARVRRAQEEAAAKWYRYREALEKWIGDPSQEENDDLKALRKDLDAARRSLAARREELRARVTKKEEARLVLRGILEQP